VGFYIRKAFRFGPFRINVSKSGVGASVGVKGLRVSTGPRGTELHAGRGGVYYREKLGSSHEGHPHTPAARPNVALWIVLAFVAGGGLTAAAVLLLR
jgi:hypothetical protein